MLDPQVRERPANMREAGAVDRAPGLRREERPAGPIGVQGDGQAEHPKHLRQSRHDGRHAFNGPELGVEQPLGGVIEDGDQRLPLVGTQRQPGVGAAVQMQQLTKAWAGLAAPAMPAARAARGHQPGLLQGGFHQRVGEGHVLVATHELVEVADVEPRVPLPIEAQDPLDLGKRRQPARGALAPPIEQPVIPHPLLPSAPATQTARMHAQNVGRL